MKSTTLVIIAITLLAVGISLPLVGIERYAGDFSPVVLGLVCLAGSAGACMRLLRPAVFEHYVKIVCLAFVALAALGSLGYMTDNGIRPAEASAAMTTDTPTQADGSHAASAK